jgi:hypothetical protein
LFAGCDEVLNAFFPTIRVLSAQPSTFNSATFNNVLNIRLRLCRAAAFA